MDGSSLYDSDFYAWANEQAALLRFGKLDALDIENLVEEIECLARREESELCNRLRALLRHLLLWISLPGRQCGSWRAAVTGERRRIEFLLRDCPSLLGKLDEVLSDAYCLARLEAGARTGVGEASFPVECPWGFSDIMSGTFWPEG